MPRIPDSEIERLKATVSLVRLVEQIGVTLKRHGKEWIGRCPFHDDKTPSLVISPKANLWHCLGACQAGGSVIDWVMKAESVSFRRAVELLRVDLGDAPIVSRVPAMAAAPADSLLVAASASAAAGDAASDAALLSEVIDYYHATLTQSPEALAYLDKRGLAHPEVIAAFGLGYANRTLGNQFPSREVKAGAPLRAALQRLGILRESGHEHLAGSLVVPLREASGQAVGLYGRKVTRDTKLRAGTPLHLYLPGPHRGVFNESGLAGQEEVILCEALIDALTFWCAGYRNVTSAYGIEGFTPEILDAFTRHAIKRVLIAYDADDAGNAAAEKLATKLMAAGFECYRCRFPKGSDANQYALDVTPATKSLGVVIRQAEWIGNGTPSLRAAVIPTPAPSPVPIVAEVIPALVAEAPSASPSIAPLPEPPAYRVPPSEPPLPVEIVDKELRLTLGDRAYLVRGIEKNLGYEQLKVWLRVTRAEFFHLDTPDLAQQRQRAGWIKQAAMELGLSEEVTKADLGKLLRAVETQQQALIQAQLAPKGETAAVALTAEQHELAMALLTAPDLVDRIVRDVEAIGVVGEGSNVLVAYLACVSRKLDKPLAILIQSTSAAGKSTLMEALLSLMPEAERVHYSAMTGQSLFYLGEHSMKHKILAIAEEEGVRQAAYALKLLQSQGELTIASTGKDPATGELKTQEYHVEGPVMLFLTTTAIDLDEELLNRCLVLTINESREQTAAIQARQRAARTLDGLLSKVRSDDVLAAHRAAQALLRPLVVVNPYADQLTFASDRVRLRRDQQKYLTLIEAIALLHQHQRPIRSAMHAGKAIEYLEVTRHDIALANRLAHGVLGRSLDELPPQTRRLLGQLQALVAQRAQAQAIEPRLVRFTRRELRAALGISEKQLRVHVDRLVELDYVIPHAGRNGQRFVYELAFDGDAASDDPQVIGLMAVDRLCDGGTTVNLVGVNANLVGQTPNLVARSWPASGDLVATSWDQETPRNASADAVSSSLIAAVAETALLEPSTEPRRSNGASYASTAPAARR